MKYEHMQILVLPCFDSNQGCQLIKNITAVGTQVRSLVAELIFLLLQQDKRGMQWSYFFTLEPLEEDQFTQLGLEKKKQWVGLEWPWTWENRYPFDCEHRIPYVGKVNAWAVPERKHTQRIIIWEQKEHGYSRNMKKKTATFLCIC